MSGTWQDDLTVVPGAAADGASARPLLAGRYQVGALLGRGGSGQVHRAVDELTGDTVAVKFVRAISGGAARQLRRELIALRLLDLPGVVRLLDDGFEDSQHFLVMDLLVGGPFDQLAGPWEQWREAALTLLEGLSRVHCAGVVHRDLKPGNILLDAAGRPVLTDFGLAQGRAVEPARAGAWEGTPRYMAPEQRRGEPCDARADLYALGVMFGEMLRGTRIPRPVSQVLRAMTAPDPDARPESAMEVVEALDADRPGLAWLARSLPSNADVQALRELFDEPEVTFLHLAEDAADILHRRTGGDARRVAMVLQRWVRAGRCHVVGDRLVTSRVALDALLAEEDPVAPERALAHARSLRARGAMGRAFSIVEAIAGPGEGELSVLAVDLALSIQRVEAIRRARWLALRHGWPLAHLLLDAAHAALHVDAARGLEQLELMPAPDEPTLAGWRLALALNAASRVAPPSVALWVEEARRWAGDDASRNARLSSWLARVAYVAGRHAEALELDERAAMGAETDAQRVARLTTAAAAALELPGSPRVEALAAEAEVLARRLRHPLAEARAVWLSRTATYRSGRPIEPRTELVDAAAAVSPAVAAQMGLTEASIAWRTGRGELAAALAVRAASLFRALSFPDGEILVRSLALAAGADVDPPTDADVERCQAEFAVQVAALCVLARHPVRCPFDPASFAGRPLDVLSGDECIRVLVQNEELDPTVGT